MEWAVPVHDREAVNKAGKTLINSIVEDEVYAAIDVIDNWRSSHSYPLNTFQITLRERARTIDPDSLVAQRLKRIISIYRKLDNERTMKLSQMQDLGGCRAVVRSPKEVRALERLYRNGHFKHELSSSKDYITTPRPSGYRGVHLIYKYKNEKNPAWDELKIEVQIRSLLQHAWATTVETVDIFTQYALKANKGPDDWRRFFALMGSALAIRERRPLVPGTPSNRAELFDELRECAEKVDVIRKLETYGSTIKQTVTERPSGGGRQYYLLLEINPEQEKTTVRGFRKEESQEAAAAYSEAERRLSANPPIPGIYTSGEVVLVSVPSLQSLRRAFPNYFFDTELFLDALRRALKA